MRERSRSAAFRASVVVDDPRRGRRSSLPSLLDSRRAAPRTSGSPVPSPASCPRPISDQGDAVGTTVRVHRYDDVAAGEEAVRDGDVDVLVVDAQRLEWRGEPTSSCRPSSPAPSSSSPSSERAAAAGIDPDELLALVAPVPVDERRARPGRRAAAPTTRPPPSS